jgi:uncharacterized surface protein with fasciclin (FAS1) repeats
VSFPACCNPRFFGIRFQASGWHEAHDGGGALRVRLSIQPELFMHKILLAATAALCLGAASASAANVVDTAKAAGSFNTLLAAAQAAGLADALATTQNITVFAPTDEAFAKLPAGTVENLLKPENKDQLVAILTYHVVPRKLASNQMLAGPFHVRTLKAKPDRTLAITKGAGGVTVDNATVIKADIMTDNGIIHVIDTVMLPSK